MIKLTSQDLEEAITNISSKQFVDHATLECIQNWQCGFCRERVGDFEDALSVAEFKISGLCQSCQNAVFQEEQDKWEHTTNLEWGEVDPF